MDKKMATEYLNHNSLKKWSFFHEEKKESLFRRIYRFFFDRDTFERKNY
jgi:hypothetical protein